MIIILLLSIFCFLTPLNTLPTYAKQENFAQIQKANVYLYSQDFSPLFEIPFSYYVKLLEKSEGEYYKCQYLDITGYVKKKDIVCCESLTTSPYLNNISFRILASQSAELRSEPSRKKGLATLLAELNLYETNFSYIGKLQGEEVVLGRGDIWYYAKYIKNNIELTGYIYAGLCDQLTAIPILEMNSTPIEEHNWVVEIPKEETPVEPQITLPSSNEFMIIAIVSIPVIILLAILAFSKKSKKETKQEDNSNIITIKQRKFKKGKDYYELE